MKIYAFDWADADQNDPVLRSFIKAIVARYGKVSITFSPAVDYEVTVYGLKAKELGPIVRKYWDENCSDEDLEEIYSVPSI